MRTIFSLIASVVMLFQTAPIELAIITPENADQLQPLAILGRGQVFNLVIAPNNDSYVTTTSGVWHYSDPSLEPELLFAGDHIRHEMRFHAENNWLLAESLDGDKWFDLQSHEPLDVPYRIIPTFSPDQTHMTAGSDIVDLSNNSTVTLRDAIFDPFHTVFSPDKTLIATQLWCADCPLNTISLVDATTGDILTTIPVPDEIPAYADSRRNRVGDYRLVFSQDNTTLIGVFESANSPHTEYLSANLDMLLWKVDTLLNEQTAPADHINLYDRTDNLVRRMAVSPDFTIVAVQTSESNGGSHKVFFYDIATGSQIAQVARNNVGFAFTPDNRPLAYAVSEGTLQRIDAQTQTVEAELPGYTRPVDRANPDHWHALHPAGETAITLWLNLLGSPVAAQQQQDNALSGDWSVQATSQAGGVLAGGGLDGDLGIGTLDGERLATFTRHNDEIAWVAFNTVGTLIITSEPYGDSMILWGIPTRDLPRLPQTMNPVPEIPAPEEIQSFSYQGIG